jgi:hypothetical protein
MSASDVHREILKKAVPYIEELCKTKNDNISEDDIVGTLQKSFQQSHFRGLTLKLNQEGLLDLVIYKNDTPFIVYEVKTYFKDNERFFREKIAEEDQRRKEENLKWEKNQAAYERRIKRIDEEMGKWSKNQGHFAEEYFYNSFDYCEQDFFGEHFDTISRCLKPRRNNFEDEYDIVLFNCTSVAIIEVKYKAHENDIPTVLKKAETFRVLCPDYKDYKIYLALASMAFYPELEQKCIEQGIAMIKQVGDMVVVDDGHLKVF